MPLFDAVAPALLVLEDGAVFRGRSFGAPAATALGELVFNTSMTGYEEIVTDPSYRRQIVVLTAPQIGNYGVARRHTESGRVQAAALVVREASGEPSGTKPEGTLGASLAAAGVPAIDRVDTRGLTLRIRRGGALRAGLSSAVLDPDELLAMVRAIPPMEGLGLVGEVSCAAPRAFAEEAGGGGGDHDDAGASAGGPGEGRTAVRRRRVALFDYGVKSNIARLLVERGADVRLLPADFDADAVLAEGLDGVVLSNGPGDPAALPAQIDQVRRVATSGVPTFGICLGHQLLALALGGRTFKLRFGHRGGNHPVREERTGRVLITSQNHGFCVDPASLPPDVEVSHVNLFDQTCAGLRHRRLPVFSVQFHPEASPGPNDARPLFEAFFELMDEAEAAGRGASAARR